MSEENCWILSDKSKFRQGRADQIIGLASLAARATNKSCKPTYEQVWRWRRS